MYNMCIYIHICISSLFFFVVYVIGTLLYFLLGTPVPTNEYNSISSVRARV